MALGGVIFLLVFSFFVYNFGYENAFNESEARQKIAVEAALTTYKKRVTQAITSADNFEKDKKELEKYNDKLEERIKAYINKPSSSGTGNCLDVDGVQLFNSISEGRDSSDTSELKRTLQKGITETSRWWPKFYHHQPKRYLLPIRDLS